LSCLWLHDVLFQCLAKVCCLVCDCLTLCFDATGRSVVVSVTAWHCVLILQEGLLSCLWLPDVVFWCYRKVCCLVCDCLTLCLMLQEGLLSCLWLPDVVLWCYRKVCCRVCDCLTLCFDASGRSAVLSVTAWRCVLMLQEGLLSCLTVIQNITLARNAFSSYPSGGPAQFASVSVSVFCHQLVPVVGLENGCKQWHLLSDVTLCQECIESRDAACVAGGPWRADRLDVDWPADVMERDEWTEMHAVLKFVH